MNVLLIILLWLEGVNYPYLKKIENQFKFTPKRDPISVLLNLYVNPNTTVTWNSRLLFNHYYIYLDLQLKGEKRDILKPRSCKQHTRVNIYPYVIDRSRFFPKQSFTYIPDPCIEFINTYTSYILECTPPPPYDWRYKLVWVS